MMGRCHCVHDCPGRPPIFTSFPCLQQRQDSHAVVTIEAIIDELCADGYIGAHSPALTSKQSHALVSKHIRGMIKSGSLIGLPVASNRGLDFEYSYRINPLFHKHDFASTPVLCLDKMDRTPLRVFHRFVWPFHPCLWSWCYVIIMVFVTLFVCVHVAASKSV